LCTFENQLLNSINKHIAFISLGIVFLLLQTQNAMVDSWYYAACIKHKTELINSHHLFYNYAGYYWYHFILLFFPNTEAICALNTLNAIAAVAALYLFYNCLKTLKVDSPIALWLSLFCGVSFGFMRYACDAETYILPIVFSLASTLFYISKRNFQNLIFSGFFGAMAILFHQVHVWWVVAFIIGFFISKPFRPKYLFGFILPLFLIPLSYWLCFQYSPHSIEFSQFITGEYGKGHAGIDFSLKAILLTLINAFRTIVQVHGNQMVLIKSYPLSYALFLMLLTVYFIWVFSKKVFKKPHLSIPNSFSNIFLIAFLLQLIFAFISSGNAEFMVMFPFLLVLYLASRLKHINYRLIKYLTISIFFWNIGFAIAPGAVLTISRVDQQVEYSKKYTTSYALWGNKALVENQLTYRYGFSLNRKHLLNIKTTDTNKIDSLLKSLHTIYTDIPNANHVLSREKFVNNPQINAIIGHYSFVKCDSFNNVYGKNYIYYIQKRMY